MEMKCTFNLCVELGNVLSITFIPLKSNCVTFQPIQKVIIFALIESKLTVEALVGLINRMIIKFVR